MDGTDGRQMEEGVERRETLQERRKGSIQGESISLFL